MGCIPRIKLIPINETRVKVLESANIIAGYVIKLFIVYLTHPLNIRGKGKDSHPESVTTLPYIVAVAIVNVFWGLVYMLPIVFTGIQRSSPMAKFRLLCYSSIFYCAGLGLLVLSSSKEGMKKPAAFYASLLFLATGIAGQATTRESFEKKQKEDGYLVCGVFTRCLLNVCGFLGVQMAGTMIAFIHSWPIKYGIAAAYMVAASLVFSTGICCCRYNYEEIQESNPLKILVPTRIQSRLPSCLRDGEEDESTTRSKAEKSKDVEITVHLIPMFLTFIMCGVVCSTAYTTLLAQAANLNNSRLLSFLLFFYSVGKAVGTLCAKVVSWFLSSDKMKSKQRFAPTFGIGFAMFFSVLTTIIAATVEAKMQKKRGSLSMWWLLPQSVFVGVLDGIYQASINSFFVDGLSSTRKEDILIFAKALFGAGFMGNALLVFILSRTTKWIPEKDLGSSTSGLELEKYYWLLVVLSGINLVVYILIAICFNHKYHLTASSPSGVNKPSQAIEESEPDQQKTDSNRARNALAL
ncbi:hypothetical protein Ancab_023863 [Ancistrocladus abbreviatus]